MMTIFSPKTNLSEVFVTFFSRLCTYVGNILIFSPQVSDSVTVVKNSESPSIDNDGRGFVDQLEDFVKTHDMFVRLPFTDTTLGVSPRNLDNNELSFSLRSPNSDAVEGKSRKFNVFKVYCHFITSD